MRLKKTHHPVYLTLIVAMLLWVVSCAVNPVTGKRELMLMSESDEIAMGQSSDPQVVQMYGLYDDANLQQFVETMGNRMAPISHRPELKYHFRVMDTPVINAFAVPGGYVYFTRGILAYLNSEAEFAGVLGHELGHITARHSAKQYSKTQLAQVGLGLGVILSEDFARFAGVAQTGLGLLFLKYGRDQERQSDELGVAYSTAIGYNAHEMANFFKTLDRMNPDNGGLPGWMSTHPNSAERVENIGELANAAQKGINTATLKINRDEFLTLTDGLVFGNDPRQGYVENNIFYHPQMRFLFPVPADWRLNNTPSQVQMGSDDQKAGILLMISNDASLSEAAQNFQSQYNATVVSSESAPVNGLNALQVISQIQDEQNTLRLLSYYISYGNLIYNFHGFTGAADFNSYAATFRTTMGGFRQLTDQAKINVQPDRVRVKTVARNGTLRDALLALQVPDDQLENTALMNGMQLTDTVSQGTRIKIVGK